jgi:hypothetical protein
MATLTTKNGVPQSPESSKTESDRKQDDRRRLNGVAASRPIDGCMKCAREAHLNDVNGDGSLLVCDDCGPKALT